MHTMKEFQVWTFEHLGYVITRQTHTSIMFLERRDGLKVGLGLDASLAVVLTETHEPDIGGPFVVPFQIIIKRRKGFQGNT